MKIRYLMTSAAALSLLACTSPTNDSDASQAQSRAEPKAVAEVRSPVGLHDATSGKGRWPVTGWNTAALATASGVSYLSPTEQEIVLHLNMVRSDPARYAREFIEPRIQYYVGKIYRPPWTPANFGGTLTREGAAALYEAVAELKATKPLGLLKPSRGISMAARDMGVYQARTGETGHTGENGENLPARLARYGTWDFRIAENVSYGRDAAVDNIVGLLVDDGIGSRGHRKTIMDPAFQFVGVSINSHPQYGHLCVMDFAGGFDEK